MASDSACWIGNTLGHRVKKMWRVKGALLGFAGDYTAAQQFLQWVKNGGHEDEYPNLSKFILDVMAVHADGKIHLFEGHYSHLPIASTSNYSAIGSGADFALGAMHAGASAVEAVRAATAHDKNSRGPIRTLKLIL